MNQSHTLNANYLSNHNGSSRSAGVRMSSDNGRGLGMGAADTSSTMTSLSGIRGESGAAAAPVLPTLILAFTLPKSGGLCFIQASPLTPPPNPTHPLCKQ